MARASIGEVNELEGACLHKVEVEDLRVVAVFTHYSISLASHLPLTNYRLWEVTFQAMSIISSGTVAHLRRVQR